ncbi:MAG: hypothetical protein L0Z55_13105 [Planctomycetes bacterium]|nr:hypothetical protein [Planctomycetota bacterium]
MLAIALEPSTILPFVIVIAIVVVAVTLSRVSRRQRYYAPSREPSPPEPRIARAGESRAAASAVAELDQAMVQIQELTREIEARLDTRVRHATRILDESQKVIVRLEQALARARGMAMPEGVTGAAPLEGFERPGAKNSPLGKHVDVVSLPPSAAAAPPAPHEVAERVHRLASEGMTAQEISARLQVPIGEVELHLSLKRTSMTS